MTAHRFVSFLDVDHTVLDNDRVVADLMRHLDQADDPAILATYPPADSIDEIRHLTDYDVHVLLTVAHHG